MKILCYLVLCFSLFCPISVNAEDVNSDSNSNSLSNPILTNEEIEVWGEKALQEIFSVKNESYQYHFDNIKNTYFTQKGWDGFYKAFDESGYLKGKFSKPSSPAPPRYAV